MIKHRKEPYEKMSLSINLPFPVRPMVALKKEILFVSFYDNPLNGTFPILFTIVM